MNYYYIIDTGGLPDTCACTTHDPDICYTFEFDIFKITAWSRVSVIYAITYCCYLHLYPDSCVLLYAVLCQMQGCNETFATFAEQSITITGGAVFAMGIVKVDLTTCMHLL